MKQLLRISSVKVLLSVLLLTMTYTSCKKDHTETQSHSDIQGTSISSAKESFEKNSKIIEPNYTGQSFLPKDLLKKRKLEWDSAFTQKNGDTVVVFVPVSISASLTLADGDQAGTSLDNIIYLRLITTTKEFDGSKAEMVSLIPDQVWKKDTRFSGHMLLENWFEPNLYVVNVTKNSTTPSKVSGDKVLHGNQTCYTTSVTTCVQVGEGQTCHTNTTTVCAVSGGGGGGGSGGNGGGGGDIGIPDHSGGGDGGGSGDGPGPTPPPPKPEKEILIDTNARKCLDDVRKRMMVNSVISTCLQNVFNRTQNNNNVAEMIKKIGESSTWHATIREGNISANENAKTTTDRGKVFITFRSDYLNKATDLSVARTMIHEMMHVYFVQGMANINDPGYDKFVEANKFLYDTDGNAQVDQNSAQHNELANSYVNQMAVLLWNYAYSANIESPDKSISLMDYCKDLAWGGLLGTEAYKSAPNKDLIEQRLLSEQDNNEKSTKKKGC